MTNKKLKMAAMSVALTACVAASPLAAKADAPEAAPEKKEPVAEETETKKEENTAEPQVNQEAKNAQETLKDAEVKYNKDNPTTNPDGSQKLDGVIVTNPEGGGETGSETDPKPNPNPNPDSSETDPNPNPDSSETKPGGETGSGETGSETGGETDPNPGSGETNPNPNPDSGETDPNPNPGSGETGSGETGGTTDPEQKKPEKVEIGTAEKTEKSETNVETKPNPGAEPIVDTTTPPTVEKNPDGSTTITQPTVTPGKETTTTTGSGEAKGNLHEKKEEVKEFDLDEELGKNPDISWDVAKDADVGNGYTVQEVENDGNQQTLKLKKEEETTAEMTAEDIAKLVDAEKPTVNPDGTYTLTRTETVLDAEGNPQTRTTYITIRDNKVTTKTTTELTITRKKAEQDGSERVDFEVKYPEITVTNKEKPEDTKTISRELLDTILSQNPKEDGSYEYTDGDGQKYEVKVDGTAEKLNNAEIVARLQKDGHTEYTLGADGEIYYTTPHNETVKLDVTQNELLRRSLTYKVTLTTTKKGETETAGEQIATEKAKKDAIRSALTTAVDQLGIEDAATASQLKAKISGLTFTQEQLDNGGTFKVKLDDGKTYILTYSAAGATVTSTPTEDKTGTGSTEDDARKAFLEKLEEARIDAEKNGETLVIEYNENGVIKTLKVDHTMKWEEVSMVVGHVVNYNAMTDAELTTYLKELEKTAQKDGKYYTGSTGWDRDTPYYRDASGKMQRVPPGKEIYGKTWDWNHGDWKYHVEINGKEYDVYYNNNDIDHLDLATDSHLTLSEKKDGKSQTTDCVLLNPTLKWSENAETLVNGGGTQANFVDRITYDDEGDKDKNTGHHEYPRASWDDDEFTFTEDNAPTKSVFYKVTGTVAYGKLGGDYKKARGERGYAAAKQRAVDALEKYKAENPGLDLSKAQVVEIYKDQTKGGGEHYYQIYLYQSDLTAYGYMSDDNNTCGNALFNAGWYKGHAPQSHFIGGYDLTLGNLTQTDEKHVVAMGKNTTAISATFKRRKLENLTNRELRYTPKSVTETVVTPGEETTGSELSGSYSADYTKTVDYTDKQQKDGIAGTGEGHYKSFTNLIQNIFKGEGTGTEEGGFIKYVYHSEKNPDGTPVQFEAKQMVVTAKQDAEVHYTFTSQESRDVWIKGYTQTVVPPVNPGPDSPELPPVEDAKPAPAPEAPVLPVVQDARPDPAPTPAPTPAPAPETPVLPAVQDAKLIQTGTSGWLADLMLGAGMVLSAAGYWMERKRKAMFYKSQH